MKTRTLLLLAVGCGLVILVAGSVKLFLISDDTAPAHLSVGQTGTIGDMSVTVQSVRRTAAETLIGVRLVGVDDDDGARSFLYGTGTDQLEPTSPPADAGPACSSTRADEPTECVLAFASIEVPGVLGYRRAEELLRWDIVGS